MATPISKVYAGFPDRACTTRRNEINADLLRFFKGAAGTAAGWL
jgi:hypothetical protein